MDRFNVLTMISFKFRMWKFSWLLLIGFVLAALGDLFSTMSVGDLVQYMETNPVYINHGWLPVILLNIIALYTLLKAYDSKAIHNRFMVITAFVYLTTTRIFVIINNFKLGGQVQAGEITKEMVIGVSDAAKTSHYSMLILASIAAPLLLNMIVYGLFKLDHKVEKNE